MFSSLRCGAWDAPLAGTFGVLTVLDEKQAAKRSYAGDNHGESWGKTAVEMAVLRQEALGMAKKGTINLGFGAWAESRGPGVCYVFGPKQMTSLGPSSARVEDASSETSTRLAGADEGGDKKMPAVGEKKVFF